MHWLTSRHLRFTLLDTSKSGSSRSLSGARAAWMLMLCLAACVLPAQVSAQRVPSRDSALRLLDRARYEQAIEAFERIAEARPDDGLSWFDLSQAHHVAGEYEAALEFGRRAAEFPGYRATCLYNLACSYALMGKADNAAAELEQALAAGFLDYDLIATDTDLELLRSQGRLELPEQHEYETLHHNSVEIPYRLLLPQDYDPMRTYPAVVAFAPGGMGRRSTDWTLTTIWADKAARAGWIVVCAAQPDNGWINHPSHHALNALMADVRRSHHVEHERFHFVGLGQGGRPAATYALMSRRYVASVTLVDSTAFSRWDDDDIEDFAKEDMPVHLVVTEIDGLSHAEASRVEALLRTADGVVALDLVKGGGLGLRGVQGGWILQQLEQTEK